MSSCPFRTNFQKRNRKMSTTAVTQVFGEDRNISRTLLETPIKFVKVIFNYGQAEAKRSPSYAEFRGDLPAFLCYNVGR